MRVSIPTAASLLLALAISFQGSPVAASPSLAVRDPFVDTGPADGTLLRRDGSHGHGHGGHHAQPIVELNETELARWHSPTPISYYTFDFEREGDADLKRRPGFMIAHIVFMSVAFFGALPIGTSSLHPKRSRLQRLFPRRHPPIHTTSCPRRVYACFLRPNSAWTCNFWHLQESDAQPVSHITMFTLVVLIAIYRYEGTERAPPPLLRTS